MNKKTSAISWTESIWHTKSSHNFFNEIYTAYAFYFFCFYEFPNSSSTLQASWVFTLFCLFCLVFLFTSSPQKKQTHPEYCSQPKTPLLPTSIQSSSSSKSWEVVSKLEVGPMFLFGHETKIERQKNKSQWKACIDIFQMIQMYGIFIT